MRLINSEYENAKDPVAPKLMGSRLHGHVNPQTYLKFLKQYRSHFARNAMPTDPYANSARGDLEFVVNCLLGMINKGL